MELKPDSSEWENIFQQLPPSGFSARRTEKFADKLPETDPIVFRRKLLEYHQVAPEGVEEMISRSEEICRLAAEEYDLAVERKVFEVFTVGVDVNEFSEDDILASWDAVSEEEKDFYRLIIEKVFIKCETDEEVDQMIETIRKDFGTG